MPALVKAKPIDPILRALQEQERVLRGEPASQMPLWPDTVRAIPNEPARSSLFTVRRGTRRHMLDEVISVLGDGQITYRGEELRTEDQDVWLCLIHMSRAAPVGEPVAFAPYALLKELQLPHNSKYYERLKTIISRLKATSVQITSNRLEETVGISMIQEFNYSTVKGSKEQWKVWLSPKILRLFSNEHFTRLHWNSRLKLTPVAKRLMDYFCSHKHPYPTKITALLTLVGSSATAMRTWRSMLRAALGELVVAQVLLSFEITANDMVVVKRNLSKPADTQALLTQQAS